jgi:hypothetical protein
LQENLRRIIFHINSFKIHWAEIIFILGFLVFLFVSRISSIEFMGDESQWIATSAVYEAFISGNFSSPVWVDNYWNEVNPVVPRYLIGIGREMGGFGANNLNEVWVFTEDFAYNQAHGALPSPNLLWWSRLPMAVLAAGMGLILFLLVTPFAGRVVGYSVVFLLAINGAIQGYILRAMSESPMAFFIFGTILATVKVFSSVEPVAVNSFGDLFKQRKLWLGWLLTGLLLGAATASKINSFAMFFGQTALWILLSILVIQFKTRALRNRFILIGTLLMAVTAFFFFVIINPYTYPDIFINSFRMLQTRIGEFQVQQVAFPQQAIKGIGPRITLLVQRIFEDFAAIHFAGAWIMNLGLFLVGVIYFVSRYRHLNFSLNWSGVAIILAGGSVVLPMLLTPIDWDRYYLLPVLFSQIFIATGLIYLFRKILEMANFWGRPAGRPGG